MPTIGVAVAIPEPWATELQEYRTSVGDTTASMIPTHITLVPPTRVGEDLADLQRHLTDASAGVPAYRVHLRGTGTFRPVSAVVFVAVAEGIAECEHLERTIRTGPLAQELRFNYHPHVTVAHEVPDAALDAAFDEMATYEARFEVAGFSLYEHGDDGVWRPEQVFPLTADAGTATGS